MVTILLNFVRGFVMGSADVVPGVSGGTVALVFGIYPRLVASVRAGAGAIGAGLRLDWGRARRRLGDVDWRLIGPLGVGIILAIVTLARLIEWLLEHHPVEVSAVFFGLVAASIVVAAGMVGRWDRRRVLVFAGFTVAFFFLLGLRSGPVNDPALAIVAGAGAVAICAMILPGVSGSFLLLMLGMYDVVLGAVNDRDLVVVGVFALGAGVGLGLFSTFVDWLLSRHHDTTLAALVGLMLGSLRVLWPWPDGTESTTMAWPGGDWPVPVGLMVGAAAVVLVVTVLARRRPGGRSGAASR